MTITEDHEDSSSKPLHNTRNIIFYLIFSLIQKKSNICHSPNFSNQPSRSGLKNVCVRSFPSSSGILKGSFLILSYRFCRYEQVLKRQLTHYKEKTYALNGKEYLTELYLKTVAEI